MDILENHIESIRSHTMSISQSIPQSPLQKSKPFTPNRSFTNGDSSRGIPSINPVNQSVSPFRHRDTQPSRPQEPTRCVERLTSSPRKGDGSPVLMNNSRMGTPKKYSPKLGLSTTSPRLSLSSPRGSPRLHSPYLSPRFSPGRPNLSTGIPSPTLLYAPSPKPTPYLSPRTPDKHTFISPEKLSTLNFSPIASIRHPDPLFFPNIEVTTYNPTEPDFTVRKMYEKEIAKGNIDAILWFAREYRRCGQFHLSIEFFERAWNAGSQDGLFELGILLHAVSKDFVRASRCYEKVIKRNPNNDMAITCLGLLYFHGNGVPHNRFKSVELWKTAVGLNNRNILALQCLACCHFKGIVVNQSYETAFELATRVLNCVNRSNPQQASIGADACLVIGHIYRKGYGNHAKDIDLALEFYKQSGNQGNPKGFYLMADIYTHEYRHDSLSQQNAHYYQSLSYRLKVRQAKNPNFYFPPTNITLP